MKILNTKYSSYYGLGRRRDSYLDLASSSTEKANGNNVRLCVLRVLSELTEQLNYPVLSLCDTTVLKSKDCNTIT